MPLTGTFINVGSIIAGCCIGLLFRKGLPEKYLGALMKAIGLAVMVLGVQYALETRQTLCLIISIIIGTLLGTALKLHDTVTKLGDNLNKKFGANDKNSRFAEAFVTSTLLYCTGAMAVTGAIQGGLSNDHTIMILKSVMDGVTAIFLTSAMGSGVFFSAIAVLIYQGLIALGAGILAPVLSDSIVTEMSAVGGVALLGLSLNMMDIKQIKITDMLPSIFLPIALLPLIELLLAVF